jgi:BMFP domain-containing protein YqiC
MAGNGSASSSNRKFLVPHQKRRNLRRAAACGQAALEAASSRPHSSGKGTPGDEAMTQTQNRLFDEMARLVNDAASVAQGVKREAESVFRTQMERIVADLDLVKREEFDVVREMASMARAENETLKQKIAELEAKLAAK